jgi:site-specific DNA recombinase
MRAAIYIRVSTDEQIKGYGLIVQDEKLRAFVKLHDYELDEEHVYKDEGFSGSLPVEERPGIKKLLEDARNREFDVVITYRLDRMFRKTKLLLEMVDELEKCKVGFKSMTESFDTTSVTGKGLMSILAVIAEMERGTIQERTMNGRASAARDGKWVTGVPPYGYTLNKKTKKLKVHPEEARWVKTFFKWVVTERLSLRVIQQRANEMKIPLPRRKVSEKKTLNYWHKRTIGRILTNETYTGTAYFRKYKRPFNNLTSLIDENMLRDKAGWISIIVPSIVSKNLFEESKQQLIKNREFSARNQKRTYLFSKIIYCGNCGFKLFGGFQPSRKEGGTGTKYYHGLCTKNEVGTTKRCSTCDQIAEVRLLPIWDRLKEILKKPELTLNKLAKYNGDREGKDDSEERLVHVNKALDSLNSKRLRFAQLYAEGEIEYKAFKNSTTECKAQEDQLQQEKLRLQRHLLTKKEIKEISDVINTQYKKLTDRLDMLTYEEKQTAMRLLLKRIIVHPKKAEAEVELNFNSGNNIPRGLIESPIKGLSYAQLRDNNAG